MRVSEIMKLLEKNTPYNIRLYLISNDSHYFINNGKIKPGFSKVSLSKTRTSILDSFSKMGFLFDELIRLRIVGYIDDSSSRELLYLLNLIPINRKIRTFLDWNVFDPKFTKQLSRLFEVRNDVIHSVLVDDVNYILDRKLLLGTRHGFEKFKKDFGQSWKKLLQIYVSEQNKIDFNKLTKDSV